MKSKNKKRIKYGIIIVLFATVSILLYIFIKQNAEKAGSNFVAMGYIENSKTYTGYLVKEETVIDVDSSKTSVPVIAEGQRASKDQTIAVYSSDNSINSAKTLAEMDSEILEANKNLPEVYDSEVQSMDSEILMNIKSIEGETSYNNIQDTKTVVNNLLNKRAKVVSENSPEGSVVRDLITARNNYEESTQTSKDNIKAVIGGIISYKLDGLENNKTFNNLGAISFSDIKEKLKSQKISNGVKIVNNYEAYILLEVKDVDKKYLEVGNTNKIRAVGIKNIELEGIIYRVRDLDENTYEIMYKISNNIEELASIREIELEIVWVNSYGLYLPNEAIKIKDDISYITVIKYGENIDVPVNIKRKNDKYSIVTNIENKTELKGTWDGYNVKVYDELVIDKTSKK